MKGHIIDTNTTESRRRDLATEFGELRTLRPGLNKAVLYVSLSAMPGEHLTATQ